MENQKIDLEKTTINGGTTVITVVRTAAYARHTRSSLSFYGVKQPLYIIVKTAGVSPRAFCSDGQETTPGQIISKYPHLKDELEL
jgi:hypothetical protein